MHTYLFLAICLAFSAYAKDDGILIIGDTGKDNEGQAQVADAMMNYCESELCNLGMLAGDVVYPTGVSSADDPILKTMFDKYYNKLKVPFLISLGNHDYGTITNDWKRGSYQLKHAVFNRYFVFPHYYYLHMTDNAVIAVIDTNRLFWFKDTSRMRNLIDMAYSLAKQQDKWFMVMGHHPYLSNGKHGNAGRYEGIPGIGWMIKDIIEDHVCGKAHFFIAGHEHLLQAFDGNVAGCNTQLIVSGAAAKVTKIERDTPSLFEAAELGYFYMKVDKEKVEVKALDIDNKTLYQKTHFKAEF